ncbi:MAG TPA: hypothetical protein EYF93_01285, partial [Planctomycetes bacterium]|nr:hypothetical protein [Planctomycetota bacterium]
MATVRGRAGRKTWQRLSFGRRTTRSGQIAADQLSARRLRVFLVLALQVVAATFLVGWVRFDTELSAVSNPWHWGELFAAVLLIHAGALLMSRAQRVQRHKTPLQIGRCFLLIHGFLLANWVILQQPEVSVMLLPVPLLGMVLGFLLPIHRAVLVSMVAIALTALMVSERPELNLAVHPVAMSVAMFLGSLVAIQGVQRVRSRTRILTVGFLSGLAMAVATLLLHTAQFQQLTLANFSSNIWLQDAMWGLINGIAAGVLITSALPFLEKWFDVLTEIRLMELSDT